MSRAMAQSPLQKTVYTKSIELSSGLLQAVLGLAAEFFGQNEFSCLKRSDAYWNDDSLRPDAGTQVARGPCACLATIERRVGSRGSRSRCWSGASLLCGGSATNPTTDLCHNDTTDHV
jgi:hypothetical protein